MISNSQLRRIKQALGRKTRLYLAAHHSYRGDDRARIEALAQLAARVGLPLVATNAVLYHAAHRRPLQDVLTCIREKCTIHDAGLKLEANAERHLKPPQEMARLFAGHEDALARTIEIADACIFSLDELKYEYPDEPVPEGKTPQSHLEDLTWEGAAWRFPGGIPEKVRDTLEKELALIEELDYARYFLTVHDIVHYARHLDILCQGRGSAANSAVCYCLAITNVDPTEIDLLFERFVSPERKEPPDIDVDFEHERREEVIQYIYGRYGRDRAGIAATVISYRGRSAVREVGKALGLSEDTVAALATTIWGLSNSALPEEYVRQAGLDPYRPSALPLPRAHARAARLPAPSLPACRRLRADARASVRGRAHRQRRHGGPHLHRMGQGRPRCARALESGCARSRHAHLHPQGLRPDQGALRARAFARHRAARRSRRVRHAVPGRTRSACFRSRAGRR